jgi:hypothetical protein
VFKEALYKIGNNWKLKAKAKKNIKKYIVSKEIKAEIGEIISLSYFLAKRVKSQRERN